MKRLLQITLETYINTDVGSVCIAIHRSCALKKVSSAEKADLYSYIDKNYNVATNMFNARHFNALHLLGFWWPTGDKSPDDPRVKFLNHLINELPDEKDEFVITAAVE